MICSAKYLRNASHLFYIFIKMIHFTYFAETLNLKVLLKASYFMNSWAYMEKNHLFYLLPKNECIIFFTCTYFVDGAGISYSTRRQPWAERLVQTGSAPGKRFCPPSPTHTLVNTGSGPLLSSSLAGPLSLGTLEISFLVSAQSLCCTFRHLHRCCQFDLLLLLRLVWWVWMTCIN